MKKLIVSVISVACAVPALAETQPAPTTQAVVSTEMANDRVICQRVEETGSRLGGKRVCKTAREWTEQRQHDREAAEDAQGRGIVHH
jgi:hypothetical protein